jgi:hypothetical protein
MLVSSGVSSILLSTGNEVVEVMRVGYGKGWSGCSRIPSWLLIGDTGGSETS